MKPAKLPTRLDALDAAAAGAAAARANESIEDCPYPADAPTFAERFHRRYWLRGYQSALGTAAAEGSARP